MLVSYNWLKDFVEVTLKPEELAERLTMSGFEVESIENRGDDTVLDVNVMPNRGDCLSILGIAREVAAITDTKVKSIKEKGKRVASAPSIRQFISVEVKDKKKCPRYCGGVITGLKIAPSPDWLVKRLESCGVRSINNVVDATNYVMLETGQPFHAFDLRFVRGNKIIVRTSGANADFVTLDGITRKILADELFICDAQGPIALAGVMGGANSEVKQDTTSVLLESACFEPSSIRRASKRLGLSSESSRRFERGVDGTMTLENLKRLIQLIVKIAGGVPCADTIDIKAASRPLTKFRAAPKDIAALLGIDIKPQDIKKYLARVGVSYTNNVCSVPSHRPDIKLVADITEEVARLHGYDKIPSHTPSFKMSPLVKPMGAVIAVRAKEFMRAQGFYEAINYGFCSPSEVEPFGVEPVMLANPLGVEFSAMKPLLLPGLLNDLRLNKNNGQENVRLFELRAVFSKDFKKAEAEIRHLSGVICGNRTDLNWAFKEERVDFYDVKSVCQGLFSHLGISGVKFVRNDRYSFMHPSASASVVAGGKDIGVLGMIHPKIAAKWELSADLCAFELDWDAIVSLALGQKRSFRPVDRYPSARRDVALLFDANVMGDDILSSIKDFGSDIIRTAQPFDLYRGKGIPEGKKSMAFAVTYYDPKGTLTDDIVNGTHSRLVDHLKQKFGAEVR